MALIGDIRKRSGLLIIIIGVALASFVLGDLLTKGPKKQKFNIGVVEGEDIPIISFNQRVEDNMGFRRESMNKENLTQEEQFSIRQSTWDEMVTEILMDKQYKALGLTVSPEELDELIRGANPHNYIQQSFTDPKTGAFNPEQVDNFLRNLDKVEPAMRKRYLYIEKAVKNDRLSTKYRDLVSKAYYIPKALAKLDHTSKNKQMDVRSVALRYQSIPDDQLVLADKDLKKYYEQNKYRYTQQDAARSIDYVIFELQPSQEDRDKVVTEVQEVYQEFQQVSNPGIFVNAVSDKRYDSTWMKKGQLPLNIEEALFNASVGTVAGPFQEGNTFRLARLVDVQNRPDSMRASHLLVAYQGTGAKEGVTRTKDQARKLADSLYNVIQKNRAMFKVFASTMSDDATAAVKQGDLDWFADGAMVYPFNEAVLIGRIGEILQVETRFGFHIVEIIGKKDVVSKVRIAIIERTIEPSTKTIQEHYVQASQFSGSNRNAASFEKAVVDMGLSKRSADDISVMGNNIPGIKSPREIIRWMYGDNIKKGDVSPAFDLDGLFVVALLKEIKNKGTMPFEQARQMVEPLARRDKKAELLMTKFEEASKNSTDIYSIAASQAVAVDTLTFVSLYSGNLPRYGREPSVVGKIFAMNPGDLSKPLKGDNGVYMVQVDKQNYPEPDDAAISNNQKMLVGSFKARAMREVSLAIEKIAKIEDNRSSYY